VLAFTRERGEGKVVVVLPRWFAKLMRGAPSPPLGEAWDDTRLILPTAMNGTDVFTGRAMASVEENGSHVLRMSEVLSAFPLAVAT